MNPSESKRYSALIAYLERASGRVARLETSRVSEASIASRLRELSRGVSRYLCGENLERFNATIAVCEGDIGKLSRLRSIVGVR